uniref:Putative structural protein n=1 Tax=viral metagenome TaxID=1070528 RepID=A0A6M3L6W2_9ZZZZ
MDAPPAFESAPITPEQFNRYRAAHTTIKNVRRQAAQNPALGTLVQQAEDDNEKSLMSTLTGTLFDALQVGQFTTVGAIDEMLRGGTLPQAFERAGIEFLNALPGDYDFVENWYKTHDRKPRASWERILNDHKVFGDYAYSRHTAAVVGFLADVLTDPTTYTGLGLGRAAAKLGAMGGMTRLLTAAEKAGVTKAGKFGDLFLPGFRVKQFGLRGQEAKEAVQAYEGLKIGLRTAQEQGAEGLRETMKVLMASLSEEERRLLQLFGDQPEAMDKALNNYFVRRGISGEDAEAVKQGIQKFRTTLQDWGEAEVKEGLLSPTELKAFYIPKRDPLTGKSKRVWRNFIGNRSKDELTYEEAMTWYPELLTGTEKAPFQKAAGFKTVQERVVKAHPTELDIGLSTLQRGFEHIRATTTKRFLESVLTDKQIARRIDDLTLLKDAQFMAELRKKGYSLLDLSDMKTLEADQAFKLGPQEAFEKVFMKDGGLIALPTPIVQDLIRAEKVVTNPTDWQLMWNGFKKVQGFWKGYALLTTGFHFRNMQSNFFQNWVAGINNPKHYAQGIVIQVGDTAKLPRGRRWMVEKLLGGHKTGDEALFVDVTGKVRTANNLLQEAKDLGVVNSGQYSRDIMAMDLQQSLMTDMEQVSRQRELSRPFETQQYFQKALAKAGVENAQPLSQIAASWAHTRALQEEIPVEEFINSRLYSVTKLDLNAPGSLTSDDLLQTSQNMFKKRSAPVGQKKAIAEERSPLSSADAWEAAQPGQSVLRVPQRAMLYARSHTALTNALDPQRITSTMRRTIDESLEQSQAIGQAFASGKVSNEQILQSFVDLLPAAEHTAFKTFAADKKFASKVKELYRRGKLDAADAAHLSPQQVRRELVKMSPYSPSTISLHMLGAGFDVLSLDRYQLRHFWGTSSPTEARKLFGVNDVSQVKLTDEQGIAALEALENGLKGKVEAWYKGKGSLQRFHYETWHQMKDTEASQQAIGVLKDIPEFKEMAKSFGETKFTHDFGPEVTYLKEGTGVRRYYLLSDTSGTVYKLNPEQYQSFQKQLQQKVTSNLHEPINQQRILDHAASIQSLQRGQDRALPFLKLPNLDARFYDDALAGKAQGKLTPAELESIQKAAGETSELYQQVRGEGVIKGATQFLNDGKAIIKLFEQADESTVLHEMAHLMRRDLPEGVAREIEKWAGIKNGNWTSVKGKEAEERFAKAFERYVREGEAPLTSLEEPFNEMAQRLEDIYHRLRGSDINVRMNDDVRKAFDNLLGQGTFALTPAQRRIMDEALEIQSDTNALRKIQTASAKIFGQRGVVMKANRAFGETIENNARLAHWVGKMQPRRKPIARLRGPFAPEGAEEAYKGLTPQQAAASVRTHLFDYDELTDFEREGMRNIIPFYTWMRKNIPLQIHAMISDPGRYAKIPKLIRATESITEEWGDIPTPDYFEELNAVRLPLIANSQPVYYNPNLPFQDLNRMNWRDIVGSLSPFFKVGIEWFPQRGYSLFLDRPVERYPGQPADMYLAAQRALGPGSEKALDAIPDFLLPKTKKGEQAQASLIPPLAKIESALRASGATNPRQELDKTKLATNLMGQLFGVKAIPVDVRQQLRGNAYRTEEVLKNARMKAKELGIPIPEVEQDNRSRRRQRPKRKGR